MDCFRRCIRAGCLLFSGKIEWGSREWNHHLSNKPRANLWNHQFSNRVQTFKASVATQDLRKTQVFIRRARANCTICSRTRAHLGSAALPFTEARGEDLGSLSVAGRYKSSGGSARCPIGFASARVPSIILGARGPPRSWTSWAGITQAPPLEGTPQPPVGASRTESVCQSVCLAQRLPSWERDPACINPTPVIHFDRCRNSLEVASCTASMPPLRPTCLHEARSPEQTSPLVPCSQGR